MENLNEGLNTETAGFVETKSRWASLTYWGAIFVFLAACAETYLVIWLPLANGEMVLLTESDYWTVGLKSVPILGQIIGASVAIVGRNRAKTRLV